MCVGAILCRGVNKPVHPRDDCSTNIKHSDLDRKRNLDYNCGDDHNMVLGVWLTDAINGGFEFQFFNLAGPSGSYDIDCFAGRQTGAVLPSVICMHVALVQVLLYYIVLRSRVCFRTVRVPGTILE